MLNRSTFSSNISMKMKGSHFNDIAYRTSFKSILAILLFSILILPASAAVTFQISPENPIQGDTITITGTATPDVPITAIVSFTKTVTAAGGQYEYNVGSVKIPSGSNRFTVIAKNVNDVYISVNLFGVPLPITVSKDSISSTATISQSGVPAGTHKIEIGGRADNDASVTLEIKAEQTTTADQNGNFEYSASTSSIPEGYFTVTVSGQTKTIYLGTTQPNDDDQNTGDSSNSNSGLVGSIPTTDIVENVAHKESEQNIIVTESYYKKVQEETMVTCEFNEPSNPLKLINFTSEKYYYNVLVQTEVLQSTSALVKTPPSDNVYMNVNIWVGNTDFTNPIGNVNATIDFTVDKDWIENNNINASTIAMLHYNSLTDMWDSLSTKQIENSTTGILYQASTSGFSPFAIVGDENQLVDQNVSKIENTTSNPEDSVGDTTSTIIVDASTTESPTNTQNIWFVIESTTNMWIVLFVFIMIIAVIYLARKNT